MKYSQQLGAVLALLIILTCFLPWSYIPSLDTTITGMYTAGTDFGKPGILHIVFSILAFVLFLIPRIWAKRTNIFVSGINLAWGFKNFMLYSMCSAGDCQVKRFGLYVMLASSILLIVMALLPKLPVIEKIKKDENKS